MHDVLCQDFGHAIHQLSFGTEDEFHLTKGNKAGSAIKQIMGVTDPLAGVRAHTEKSQFMFQVRHAEGRLDHKATADCVLLKRCSTLSRWSPPSCIS